MSAQQEEEEEGRDVFLSKCIEIDQMPTGSDPGGDANHVVGEYTANEVEDPDSDYDDSGSMRLPNSTSHPDLSFCKLTEDDLWIDWKDLADEFSGDPTGLNEKYRVPDPGDRPDNSFQKDSCVNPDGGVGSDKFDLLGLGLANNAEVAYTWIERQDNNGDSAWIKSFNQVKPNTDAPGGKCGNNQYVTHTISHGDVLIVGNFQPSGGARLDVYQAVLDNPEEPIEDVPAQDATDFESDPWELQSDAVLANAVNTTPTLATDWAFFNVKDPLSSNGDDVLEKWLVAEAAIDMSVFTEDLESCDAVFWVSALSQSSGSGGDSPALHDYIAPEKFNLLDLEADLTVETECDGVTMRVDPAAGTEFPEGTTCNWTMTCFDSVNDVRRSVEFTGCETDISQGVVLPAGTDPTSCKAEVTVSGAGLPEACGAEASEIFQVPHEIKVEVAANPPAAMCMENGDFEFVSGAEGNPTLSDDDVTYTVTATGGNKDYTFQWKDDSGSDLGSSTCVGTDEDGTTNTCTLDPTDDCSSGGTLGNPFCHKQFLKVTVDDKSNGVSDDCPAETSNLQKYVKETTITTGLGEEVDCTDSLDDDGDGLTDCDDPDCSTDVACTND